MNAFEKSNCSWYTVKSEIISIFVCFLLSCSNLWLLRRFHELDFSQTKWRQICLLHVFVHESPLMMNFCLECMHSTSLEMNHYSLFWQITMYKNQALLPPLPRFDFTKKTVIVVWIILRFYFRVSHCIFMKKNVSFSQLFYGFIIWLIWSSHFFKSHGIFFREHVRKVNKGQLWQLLMLSLIPSFFLKCIISNNIPIAKPIYYLVDSYRKQI